MNKDYIIKKCYIKIALLYGILNVEINIEVPEVYDEETYLMFTLKKSCKA